MVFGIVVAGLAGTLLLKLQPYVRNTDDFVATLGQWVILAQLFAGLLKRVQDLLPEGVSVAGKEEAFDQDAVASVVVVAVFFVPALAVVASAGEAFNDAWEAFLEKYAGTPEGDVLQQTPLLRRLWLMVGKGAPEVSTQLSPTSIHAATVSGGAAPRSASSRAVSRVARISHLVPGVHHGAPLLPRACDGGGVRPTVT
jgi:hypothetical protein